MDRSAPAFPSDLFEFALFDDHRHRRVAFGESEHFPAVFAIILCVLFGERYSLAFVPGHSLCAVRAAWLCEDNYVSQLASLLNGYIAQVEFSGVLGSRSNQLVV